MEVIKVNDKKYNIPTEWNDITIGMQVMQSRFKQSDSRLYAAHFVNTYTGIPVEILKRMKVDDFKAILMKLKFLTSTKVEDNSVNFFEHKGIKYNVLSSLEKAETQDFLSIESLLQEFKDNQVEAMPYIIAILAKKPNESLDDYDVMERGREFMDLPYPMVAGIWVFFCQLGRISVINSPQFSNLQRVLIQQSLNYTENTLRKRAGLGLLKRLLKATLLLYIRYINKNLKNFLVTSPSETSVQTLTKE
jgi:hypothetical protein